MAAKYDVGDNVTINGKVVEVVSNEDFGTRYSVKVRANDKAVVINFEEDELNNGAENNTEGE